MGQEISMDDYESDSSLQSILQCEYINYHLFCTRAIKMYTCTRIVQSTYMYYPSGYNFNSVM